MTKKEQAEMDRIKTELALAWPRYEKPPLMDTSGIPLRELRTGWWWNAWRAISSIGKPYGCVSEGCTNGASHSSDRTDKTTTQGPGRFTATRLDALKLCRWEVSEQFAERLRAIDKMIEEEESK